MEWNGEMESRRQWKGQEDEERRLADSPRPLNILRPGLMDRLPAFLSPWCHEQHFKALLSRGHQLRNGLGRFHGVSPASLGWGQTFGVKPNLLSPLLKWERGFNHFPLISSLASHQCKSYGFPPSLFRSCFPRISFAVFCSRSRNKETTRTSH